MIGSLEHAKIREDVEVALKILWNKEAKKKRPG